MKAEKQGKIYLNQIETAMSPEGTSMWNTMGKMLKGTKNRRPSEVLDTAPINLINSSIQPGMPPPGQNSFIWLGHSSLYLRLDDVKLLIDPVFSSSASPIPFLGPKAFKYSNPYSPEQFHNIDAILISHDHYDHLDKQAIKFFKDKVEQFIVPMNLGEILQKWGVDPEKITEVNWGDNLILKNKIKLVAETGRHFSGRGILNRNSTLWCSYIIESKSTRIFFSGDSGYGPHFKKIGDDYGPFDLAFIECGQYNENWPLIHMMPEETAQASSDLSAASFVPIHWSKFALSLHAWDEPPKRAEIAAQKSKTRIILPIIGDMNYLSDD